jgi:hypothetical protein
MALRRGTEQNHSETELREKSKANSQVIDGETRRHLFAAGTRAKNKKAAPDSGAAF